MFICATAGVREILNKGPLKVCFARNTFCPPECLCIYLADANNGLSTVKQGIWTTKLRSSFTRITWFVESTSKTACLWILLQETLLYTMQYRRCLPFPVASHRLHFFDGFKFTARFVRVKNLSGDDRQTVPCVFMAAVVGTETYLFN